MGDEEATESWRRRQGGKAKIRRVRTKEAE